MESKGLVGGGAECRREDGNGRKGLERRVADRAGQGRIVLESKGAERQGMERQERAGLVARVVESTGE